MLSPINPSHIPPELRQTPQWVLWRGVKAPGGKLQKRPYTVHLLPASSTNPQTWSPFLDAWHALPVALETWELEDPVTYGGGGIGFVLTGSPYGGLDLDKCRDQVTGQIAPWAEQLLRRLETYSEISPSGTGLRAFFQGAVQHGRNCQPVELYSEGRFLTVTGESLAWTPQHVNTPSHAIAHLEACLEPLSRALTRYGSLASDLFCGAWQQARSTQGQPYPSQSQADLAWCALLVQCGAHADACDAAMRLSGLYRPKWDAQHGAQTYGQMTIEKALHQSTFVPGLQAAPAQGTPAVAFGLRTARTGTPYYDVGNVKHILQDHPYWEGKLWWDSVRQRACFDQETLIDDTFIVHTAAWLGDTFGMSIAQLGILRAAVLAVAQEHPRDVLAEAVHALPAWDGIPRLETWLHTVAATAQTPYSAFVGRIWCVAMIARAMDPGCMQRYVPILEGEEERGKSSLIRLMATPAWYLPFFPSLESKEAHMQLQGAWLAEIMEMEAVSRAAEARTKAFLTLQEDVYIPKYGNFPVRVPRRTVFIGTTNETDHYLKGQTGNTRYLPIRVGQIDLAVAQAEREQYLAEALVWYRAHAHAWWQIDAVVQPHLDEEREQRRESSVYEEILLPWLDTHASSGETTWQEIATGALQLKSPGDWSDKVRQMQVGMAMRALGWERIVRQKAGKSTRVWRKKP